MRSLTSISSQRNKRRDPRLIAALTLMLAAAALLLSSLAGRSHAQQDRQMVRTGSESQSAGKRIALVIGNGAYTNAPPLKNPPNDARDMAATLKGLGFDVTSGINVNQRDMKRLIREFGQKLKTGGSGLFYYAGHGVQSKGRNYLIPVDAEIQSEAEVEDSGVDASLVLNYMDDAQNGLNIVILDACRNNPFSRSFRSASDGLAQVDAPTGTLIAYATAPGRVASDGTGQNGLYTSELLKQMRVPGLSATEMFMHVRAEVMKQTGSKQVPWEASSLVGSFYFSGIPTNLGSSNSAETNSRIDPSAFELSYWETIKNSTSADDFRAYLEKYPNGQFASLARNRINSIDGAAKPTDSRTAPTNNSATELAFWDSIKNSNNAGDYRAYLKQYPNGAFTELANNRIAALETAARESERAEAIKKSSNLEGTTWDSKTYNSSHSFQQVLTFGADVQGTFEQEGKTYSFTWRREGQHVVVNFPAWSAEGTIYDNSRIEGVVHNPFGEGKWLATKNRSSSEKPNETVATNSFTGSYGQWSSLILAHFVGDLVVSPSKIEFRPTDKSTYFDETIKSSKAWFNHTPEGIAPLECSQFVKATLYKTFIREIGCGPDNGEKCRFQAESEAAAARALDAIRQVCKPLPRTSPEK